MRRKKLAELKDDLVDALPFDARILSASANNEVWSRGCWQNEIAHYAEPVPADAAKELFPSAYKFDAARVRREGSEQLPSDVGPGGESDAGF